MKDLCLIRHFYYPFDPRERRHAVAARQAGYQVDVICLRRKGEPLFDLIDGVEVYRIPLSHKRGGIMRYLFEYSASVTMISLLLMVLFLRKRYRCIQVCTMPDLLVFTTLVPRLLGAKILLDMHDPVPEMWEAKFGDRPSGFFYDLQARIQGFAVRYSDQVISVTRALSRYLEERGVPAGKITLVRNICNETEVLANRPGEVHKNGRFIVSMHGLMDRRSLHRTAIRAVCELKETIPEIRLEIAGFGEEEPDLREFVSDIGCSDVVTFHGYLQYPDLIARICGSDLGVVGFLRSSHSELIDSNKMYELITLGIPVVVSRLKSIEEMFDESCVLFFEPDDHTSLADRILEVYRDRDRANRMAVNARKRLNEDGWDVNRRRYLGVVEQLIGKERNDR